MIANPIADSAPATAIMYKPNTSASTSLNCHEKNKVKTETANNIISIEIIIKIKLFLLKMKPNAPKPNKIKAKSILLLLIKLDVPRRIYSHLFKNNINIKPKLISIIMVLPRSVFFFYKKYTKKN
jgi:hypothetical protein